MSWRCSLLLRSVLLRWTLPVVVGLSAAGCGRSPIEPRLVLGGNLEEPVLSIRSPGASEIRYGFEGGRIIKQGGLYHLFTSEMVSDPIWVKMRLAHWTSPDGNAWTRQSTLKESSGDLTGEDPRAALWSPMPVFDEAEKRWNLFYVAYRSEPNTEHQFRLNHEGRIWRALSQVPGPDGLGGPYVDREIVLEPGSRSEPWEGLQGTDSFFPYRVGDQWYALYGSAKTEKIPIESWLVGLAQAPSLGGPWQRCRDVNPVPIEARFIENPVVLLERPGLYLCVYDNDQPDSIGYSFSFDGIDWEPGHSLQIQPRPGFWSKEVRTPLGLIPEDKNEFTLFYTGFEGVPDWGRLMKGEPGTTCAVGRVSVRLVWEPVKRYQPEGE